MFNSIQTFFYQIPKSISWVLLSQTSLMESISNTCPRSFNLICYRLYPNIFISWSTCASLRCMLQSNPKITVFHHDNIFIWYRLTSKCGGIDIARLLDLCWIFYYWLQYMIGGRNLALCVWVFAFLTFECTQVRE